MTDRSVYRDAIVRLRQARPMPPAMQVPESNVRFAVSVLFGIAVLVMWGAAFVLWASILGGVQ